MNAYLYLGLGFLLIFLEFYLPGAIMGIMGTAFVVVSIILFALEEHSAWLTLLYIAFVILSLTALIKFALWKIPRTKSRFSIYSNDDQAGFQASSYDKKAIGKIGIVQSDLKPGGYILINDEQHQAISVSGYISRGEKVKVINGQEESLLVKKLDE